mmetsp:Transcript_23799/g.26406  ORF Transcript_23799/g.26406 Transcript_23799/m.26406 type:complete len:456 (-) Transcript_23799:29-1396(-)
MQRFSNTLILFISLAVILVNARLLWNDVSLHAPRLAYEGSFVNSSQIISGHLVDGDKTEMPSVSKKVLFFRLTKGTVDRVLRPHLHKLSEAVAIVIGSTDLIAGRGRFLFDTNPSTLTSLPIFEINAGDSDKVHRALETSESLNITINNEDKNAWKELADGTVGWVLQYLLMELPCLSAIAYIIFFTVRQFLKGQLFEETLPVVVLVLHLFAELTVAITALDYVIRDYFPATFTVVLFDMCVTPTLIATLLISLHWNQFYTRSGVKVNKFMTTKATIIFFIVSCLLIVIAIVSCLMRIFYQYEVVDYFYGLVSMVVAIALIIFNITTGVQLTMWLNQSSKVGDVLRSTVTKFVYRLGFVVLGYLFYLIGMVLVISGQVSTPIGFFATGICVYLGVAIVTVAQTNGICSAIDAPQPVETELASVKTDDSSKMQDTDESTSRPSPLKKQGSIPVNLD